MKSAKKPSARSSSRAKRNAVEGSGSKRMRHTQDFSTPVPNVRSARNDGYILGIEGGGTKTTWALLTPQGRIVKSGTTGRSHALYVPPKELVKLFTGVRRKLSPVQNRSITWIGAAIAGCRDERKQRDMAGILRKVWPQARSIRVNTDTYSVIFGAFGLGDGLGVIAGTGSVAFGRKNGKWDRTGGSGYLFSESGSAADIARRGLKALYLHYDRTRQVSLLGKLFLKASRQSDLDKFYAWFYESLPRGSQWLASFAPLVFEAARKGDVAARKVLRDGAEGLALQVYWLAQRMKMNAPQIAMTGSLLEKEPGYRRIFANTVRQHLPRARLFINTTPGAVGAAAMVAPEVLNGFKNAKR